MYGRKSTVSEHMLKSTVSSKVGFKQVSKLVQLATPNKKSLHMVGRLFGGGTCSEYGWEAADALGEI